MENCKDKVLEVIKNDPEFLKGDVHQALLNIGYQEWQKEENKKYWDYTKMVKWVGKNYGEFVKFAVLVGKYNQQVENGGHYQYILNAYTGRENYGCPDPEIPLHKELVALMQSFGLDKTEIGKKVYDIMFEFEPEVDCDEYVEEEYWDDEEGEYYVEEEENMDYGTVEYYGLEELDNRYYEINDEWMEFLNKLFKEHLEIEDNFYDKIPEVNIKKRKPRVKLVGEDGNAFAILARVRAALIKADMKEEAKKFMEEARQGDYNHLLATCAKYVDVY